jgi:sugar lactone lactonase YvrE/enterochelin esterase-like enzyme
MRLMNPTPPPFLPVMLCLFLSLIEIRAADDYEPGPDSKPQPGVPKGEVLKFSFEQSKIFPGTSRDYWVYVPAQYTPDQPACLYVNQDGIQWQSPTVFDNLIHKKEMPVTIGVFVMHGRVRAADTNAALDRFNRSYEYDGLGDNYVRFLQEELLPEVARKTTSDGRAIRLSTNANDRAIGGSSSGAICAFTAAWEQPDAFSRVFSAIGTYVGLRGGDDYPTLIRKYEPKPLRIFLQDGENDLNIYAGDWWMANQMMERALTFAGYEVNHVWGEGGHNGKHGTAIFPDAMRWLWKDWPQPVKAGQSKNATLSALLIPGEDWKVAWQTESDNPAVVFGMAANSRGEVFFSDRIARKILKIDSEGKVSQFAGSSEFSWVKAFGPDGRLYAVVDDKAKIIAYQSDGNALDILKDFPCLDLTVANNGNIYAIKEDTRSLTNDPGLWLIEPKGAKKLVGKISLSTSSITLSPDQSLLNAAEWRTRWIYNFQVSRDGTLNSKQRYCWLHTPDDIEYAHTGGLAVDRDGRLYAATRMGIQICDQAGRVQCILPMPKGRLDYLCFSGEKFDTLFAACGDKILKRKLKVAGANAWAPPHRPAPPRL